MLVPLSHNEFHSFFFPSIFSIASVPVVVNSATASPAWAAAVPNLDISLIKNIGGISFIAVTNILVPVLPSFISESFAIFSAFFIEGSNTSTESANNLLVSSFNFSPSGLFKASDIFSKLSPILLILS